MKGISLNAEELDARLRAVWPDFLELVLSQPQRGPSLTDSEVAEKIAKKISGRPVTLKSGRHVQYTMQFDQLQTHDNVVHTDAAAHCLHLIQQQYQHLHLFTSKSDIAIRLSSPGLFLWRESRPTKSVNTSEQDASHNRTKNYLIPENQPCRFLAEIGVMNRDGRVLAPMRHKFRQINRFLELVNDVLPHLPQDREIQIVDFGSGKSYLTFALHHLLTEIQGRSVRIFGVDLKADVIRDCSRIANELQCEGLSFHHGDISEFSDTGQQVDMMVSLHACDTATDAALAQAVRWNTPVILAVPCCQHEVASQINAQAPLVTLTHHGILKDRFAALATDAMRANILELCGYNAQIIEFIDLEHTPKNLLIRALRKSTGSNANHRDELRKQHQDFQKLLGIGPPALERLLDDIL